MALKISSVELERVLGDGRLEVGYASFPDNLPIYDRVVFDYRDGNLTEAIYWDDEAVVAHVRLEYDHRGILK